MKSLTPPLSDRHRAKANLLFEMLPINSIKVNPHNAREHGRKQIEKLMGSVSRFGLITPLVVDERNVLWCGHGRLEAAKRLGFACVPVVRASHLSESEKRAFALADNRLAEL